MPNFYRRGVDAITKRLGVSPATLERTAPLRAGLAVGVPLTAGLGALGVASSRALDEDPAEQAAAGISLGGAGAVGGLRVGLNRSLQQQDMGFSRDSVMEHFQHVGPDFDPYYQKSYEPHMRDFVRSHADFPVQLGEYSSTVGNFPATTFSPYPSSGYGYYSPKYRAQDAFTDKMRDAYSRGLREMPYDPANAPMVGATPATPGTPAVPPEPHVVPRAKQTVYDLRAAQPDISDRELARKLHPDRAATTGLDPEVAQEAFKRRAERYTTRPADPHPGRPATPGMPAQGGTPHHGLRDLVEAGAAATRERRDALGAISAARQRMFVSPREVRRLKALTDRW